MDYAFSKGAVVFLSAGNRADDKAHYTGEVPALGSTDFIQVNVSSTTARFFFQLVWFDGLNRKDLDLELYNSSYNLVTDVTYYENPESPRGTELDIAYGNNTISGPAIYYLKVFNRSDRGENFHLYSPSGGITFQNPDPNYTIQTPATAYNSIAIGAYITRTSWIDYKGVSHTYGYPYHTLAEFSSRGPRVDNYPKPNLIAPGTAIISARDTDVIPWPGSWDSFVIDNDGTNNGAGPADYFVLQGTSMATPFAAGTAALLVQRDPSLLGDPNRIRDVLQRTASNGGVRNNNDGYGLIDAKKAFDELTGTPDTKPPLISGVAAGGITQSGATISWTTDETSDSQVEYGLTTNYGSSSPLNSNQVTSHSVTLSGLAANTTFHFRVKSKDAAGNLAVSGDFTFTTLAPDTRPPMISGVAAGSITQSGATISWTTDEASDSQVEYGLTNNYGSSSPLNSNQVTSHTVTLSGLAANTTYHYRVKSKDAAGNLAVSGDFVFTTTGREENVARLARVSASSETVQWSQTADKAIDGVVDGFPKDYRREWATDGEGAGAWLKLDFPQAVTVWRVVLYDRPNLVDQVLAAELSFSDGSRVSVGELANNGAAVPVSFSVRTVTWMRFTVLRSAAQDVGLAEIEVWGSSGGLVKQPAENSAEKGLKIPSRFWLDQNYPNPFNAETKITYQIPKPCHVRLTLFDLLGRQLRSLVDEEQEAGSYEVRWDGRDESGQPVASGIYVYSIEAGSFRGSQKLAIIR